MAEPAKTQESIVESEFEDLFGKFERNNMSESVIESVTNVDWVSVKEAANVLDISERSVWRRIKKGKLEKKEEDGRTYVAIERPEVIMPDSDDCQDASVKGVGQRQSVSGSGTDTESHLLELVSDLTDRMSEMTDKLVQASGRLGFMEATNAELRRELDIKSETVKLLEDKEAKAQKEKELLENVQRQYASLEDEKYGLEEKYQEMRDRLNRYEELNKRSAWKKFSDWMLGR